VDPRGQLRKILRDSFDDVFGDRDVYGIVNDEVTREENVTQKRMIEDRVVECGFDEEPRRIAVNHSVRRSRGKFASGLGSVVVSV